MSLLNVEGLQKIYTTRLGGTPVSTGGAMPNHRDWACISHKRQRASSVPG